MKLIPFKDEAGKDYKLSFFHLRSLAPNINLQYKDALTLMDHFYKVEEIYRSYFHISQDRPSLEDFIRTFFIPKGSKRAREALEYIYEENSIIFNYPKYAVPIGTRCEIRKDDEVISYGIANCYAEDRFSYKIGREISLGRALDNLFSQSQREVIVRDYLSKSFNI